MSDAPIVRLSPEMMNVLAERQHANEARAGIGDAMTDALTAWRRDSGVSRAIADSFATLCEAVATATHAATVAEYEAKLAAVEAENAELWRYAKMEALEAVIENASNILHGGPTVADASKSFELRVIEATNLLDAARTPSPEPTNDR